MDRIILSDLRVRTIIGTLPHERETAQTLILHAELFADMTKAQASDDFHDAPFDYAAVEAFLYDYTARSRYFLLEALAGDLAEEVRRTFPGIDGIRLRIEKPAAPRYAAGVAIQVERGSVG